MAQTPDWLLERGRMAYEADQLDSAQLYYERAYRQGVPNIQIQAIGGLLSLDLLRSDFAHADSLLVVGDELVSQGLLDLEPLCFFLIRKGEYFRSNSQFTKALAQHQKVLEISADLPDSTLIYADALYYTALTFERMSVYDSSVIYIEKAYDIYRQKLDTTSVKFGNICNGLGVCYYRANRFEEAERFYLKSKSIAEQQLGPVSTDLAMVLSNLSSIYRAEQDYQQAITATERALQIYQALEDEGGIASTYYSLGVYHYFTGDYGLAKNYLEACIQIRERLYPANHYSLIGPYEVLGIAFEESGNYEKTLEYLKKARPIILQNYGPGSLTEAFNYENTSICYKNIGHLDSALYYMQRSNQIMVASLPEDDYSLGVHYFNFANLHYLLNQLDQARPLLNKSAAIYRTLGLAESGEYAQTQALQALMYAEEEKWDQADAIFAEALDLIRAPSQKVAMKFQLSPNTLWLLNEYSKYLFRKYEITGEETSLNRFEAYSQAYLQLSDNFRQQFIDPYTKSVLIKDNAEVYRRNIGIYSKLFHQTGNQKYLNTVFRFAEYGRTCLLRDLQDDKIETYAGIPDSVLQKERKLKKEISQLNQELMNKPEDSSLKDALFKCKEALQQHVRQTARTNPEYYKLRFQSDMPTLEQVQAKMAADEVLVEYMQDDTAMYALVIRPQFASLHYLAGREKVENTILEWQQGISQRNPSAYQKNAYDLYEALWQPIADEFDSEKITIIPVGLLFYLNFEVLPLGKAEGQFLIHAYNISYALSINLYLSSTQQASKGTIIAIAPGFEEDIKQSYLAGLDSLQGVDEAFLQTVRQPWSLRMAHKLKKQFVNQTFTGLQATESRIKKSIQKGSVLLFGTHAMANPSDPLRSKLLLAKEVGEQKEDGYIHAYELYGIPIRADLAVLNACESGLGQLQAGEGMISLAYSIHYAGCPSTVMSLWKVDERVSTQITEGFMEYLARGATKSEALRRAKLDYLAAASSPLQHPFYWGGMVLMGKDGTLTLKQKRSYWPWLVGFGILVFIAIGFRQKNKRQAA